MKKISFKDGSIKELMQVSLPLMFSWLSIVSMSFVDRLYLANYSLDTLNAAITASMLAWAFTYCLEVMCEMCEVLVARSNGACEYRILGRPVWQMIWLSLASIVVFLPLGIYGPDLLFPATAEGNLQGLYFKWIIFFGPAFGMIGALSAFFIGQGRGSIFTYVCVIGNVVNVILDPILIFGIDGWVPEMGIEGAAIATGIGTLIQAVVLFILFIRKNFWENFGSNLWQFHRETFMSCLKLGAPISIVMLIEIGGWGIYYSMLSQTSIVHITTAGISQSILSLFVFFGIGLNRGISTVAGNLIGAGLQEQLSKLVRSGMILITLFFGFTILPLVVFPEVMIDLFLQNQEAAESISGTIDMAEIVPLVKYGLLITCLFLFLENIRFVYSGILTAAGDTIFLMWSGVVALWVFMIIPTYYFVMLWQGSIYLTFWIWIGYAAIAAVFPFIRYRYPRISSI